MSIEPTAPLPVLTTARQFLKATGAGLSRLAHGHRTH
jgi:hypothetical protein